MMTPDAEAAQWRQARATLAEIDALRQRELQPMTATARGAGSSPEIADLGDARHPGMP